jgi:CPA1 family monovalent cation:H+ antiporter
MDVVLTNIVGLLVAAIIVALIARRLQLPYTVGLVVCGIALALLRIDRAAFLTHDLIYDVILPPLLFEAAINIHWAELRRDALPVLTLATFGTILSAVVVAAGIVFLLGWSLRPALLFGILIAATDPVAVIAMFKDNRVTGRVRLLVESESLFNDGVAAVLFAVVLAWAQATDGLSVTPIEAVRISLFTVGGGVFVGLASAGAVMTLAGRTSDYLVESALTTVSAYGSFLLAEHLQCSGVLATVTAGLLIGNFGVLAKDDRSRISRRGREFVLALWDFIAFIANSLVFLLIGLAVASISFAELGITPLIVVISLILVARALTIYPLCLCFKWSRWAISIKTQHILWWGGLRGALGLALALSLPPSVAHRDAIVVAMFAVVIFSVVVQGLTMPLFLRKLAFTFAAK